MGIIREQPSPDEFELGAVLAALADPHRRSVVAQLAVHDDGYERSCASFGLDVTKQTRSHHFRVLREAGLVTAEFCGNHSLIRLRRNEIESRFPGLLALVLAEGAPAVTLVD